MTYLASSKPRRAFFTLMALAALAGALTLGAHALDPRGRDLHLDRAMTSDSRRQANLWCLEPCRDRRKLALTVSPADWEQGRITHVTGTGTYIDAPNRDIVARFSYVGDRPALRWENGRSLVAYGSCFVGPDGRPLVAIRDGGVLVTFAERGVHRCAHSGRKRA